jgi:septum formation protein
MHAVKEMLKLVLASSSPRRRQLLAEAGYDFEVVDPPIAEPADLGTAFGPAGWAEALAYFKARSVAQFMPDAYVLGADTVVAAVGAAGEMLGKPADSVEADRMLRRLSGTRHQVITGVALLGPAGYRHISSDVTYVSLRQMTEEEIQAYVASGEWIGKAGAYAIQESADRFVEKVEGSYSNVVGLPMEMLGRMFAAAEREKKVLGPRS